MSKYIVGYIMGRCDFYLGQYRAHFILVSTLFMSLCTNFIVGIGVQANGNGEPAVNEAGESSISDNTAAGGTTGKLIREVDYLFACLISIRQRRNTD